MGLPVEINPLLISSSGYVVGRSLRFRSSASACLTRTYTATGSTQKFTGSVWVKRGKLSSSQTLFGAQNTSAQTWDYFNFNASDQLQLFIDPGTTPYNVITTSVFRDPSAWYHVVFAVDTTQATAANRVRIYVNGIEQSLGTNTIPQNYNLRFNVSGNTAGIGTQVNYAATTGPVTVIDGYLAELNWIDSTQLTPSSFGIYDSNGIWQPIKYTGTYGTNGFYLPFSNTTSTTTLVADASGNGNNWTANNISLTAGTTYDSMIDSPTVSASSSNYAVMNPLWKDSAVVIKDGNLDVSNGNYGGTSTIVMPTGNKFYCEATVTATEGNQAVGIVQATALGTAIANISLLGSYAYGYYSANGQKYVLGSASAYGSSWGTIGDVIGIAADLSGNTVTFYKNNVSQGSISIASGIDYVFGVSNATATGGVAFNFGQRPFTYTPPTGYSALNTYNLPTPTIANGAQYMAATLWTGNGTSQSIVNSQSNGGNNALGVTFQPDFVWYKGRTTTYNHALFDVTRGALQRLSSNLTSAETTTAGSLTAFNSNGFSIGNDAGANQNTDTYVGWQWKANGTGVTNTAGTITSTVSANTTAGFSVVTYTGNGVSNATVGHGLGVTPNMIILKDRDSNTQNNNWQVYHSSLTSGNFLYLNTTDAQSAISGTSYGSVGSPSATIFTCVAGSVNSTTTNESGDKYVAYCFAAIKGYSAFGSYTGNGSTDGPFVYTNFRPRYVLIKNITFGSQLWFVYDTSRSPYNLDTAWLAPNNSNAEAGSSTDNPIDILSNGFKIRYNNTGTNQNGDTYIYAAFAENPFNYSRAR